MFTFLKFCKLCDVIASLPKYKDKSKTLSAFITKGYFILCLQSSEKIEERERWWDEDSKGERERGEDNERERERVRERYGNIEKEALVELKTYRIKTWKIWRKKTSEGYDGDTVTLFRLLLPSIDQRVYNIKEKQILKHFASVRILIPLCSQFRSFLYIHIISSLKIHFVSSSCHQKDSYYHLKVSVN